MAHSEQRYLCGSAYARAVWTPPSTPEDRIVWNRWLKGMGTIIATTLALALFLASGSAKRPLEATVEMERLAAKLEQMKVIHPETAKTIVSLILQPAYDCNQIACSAAVQTRNSGAQSRLKAILTKRSGEMQAATGMPTVNVNATPTTEAERK
jgi:HAMP domain-containing protein